MEIEIEIERCLGTRRLCDFLRPSLGQSSVNQYLGRKSEMERGLTGVRGVDGKIV